MKVKIIRATVAAGRDVFPGDEVDVSAADARLLRVTGRAIPFDAPDAGDDLDAPDAPDAGDDLMSTAPVRRGGKSKKRSS